MFDIIGSIGILILECYQVAIRLKIHLAMDVGETTLSTLNWIEDWLCIFSILCEFGVELCDDVFGKALSVQTLCKKVIIKQHRNINTMKHWIMTFRISHGHVGS